MTVGTPLMWMLFAAFVVVALLVDFLAMNKQGAHKVSMGEAAVWSVIWVAVSFVFVGLLWWYLGGMGGDEAARGMANVKALEFVTGYLVEKALAVDNIFVFLLVFTYFAVPGEYQKRVLMVGILGALVLRAVMIFAGAWLIARFDWVLYLFGAFLVFTGIKMWWAAGQEPALDSIPAIFAITTDPFIVLTSNVFAILGLRAMYFLLAGLHEKFHLLTYGLAIVLILIGSKMKLLDVYHIPVSWSLAATVTVLAVTMVLSLYVPARGYTGSAYPFKAKHGKDGDRAKKQN